MKLIFKKSDLTTRVKPQNHAQSIIQTMPKTPIFSKMTKPIVSIALMQLYEQEKFKMDDPLHEYIPAFKKMSVLQDSLLTAAKNPIKVIDLLRHTS